MGTKQVANDPLTTIPVSTNTGAADDDTQRMVLASNDPAVVLLGTIDADTSNLAAIAASLATLDNAVAGNELQVDVLTMPAVTLGDTTSGWTPYTAAIATALSTEWNALASGSATAASAAIDNTSIGDTHIDITQTIDTQGGARTGGATLDIYIVYAVDGSNHDRVSSATAELLCTFSYDAATTATQSTRTGRIRPGLFKLFGVQTTGQALAATGNLTEYRTYKVLNNA